MRQAASGIMIVLVTLALLSLHRAVADTPASQPGSSGTAFPLKYLEIELSAKPALWGEAPCTAPRLIERPRELKSLPANLSSAVWYYGLPVNGKMILMAMEFLATPRLFVDTNLNQDLSDEKPLTGVLTAGGFRFGPVRVASASGGDQGKVRFLAVWTPESYFKPDQPLFLYRMDFRAGTVRVGDKSFRVAVADANFDGRYDDYCDSEMDADKYDRMVVMDNSRPLDNNALNEIAAPGLPLARLVRVADGFYDLSVAADGSSATLAASNLRPGTLDVGPDVELTINSKQLGTYNLTGQDGRWKLPPGTYATRLIRLVRTDAKGNKWALTTTQTGRLSQFQIQSDKILTVKVGSPLERRLELRRSDSVVSIAQSLTGQAGEKYPRGPYQLRAGAPSAGPPQAKIVDAAGKVIDRGSFAFG